MSLSELITVNVVASLEMEDGFEFGCQFTLDTCN